MNKKRKKVIYYVFSIIVAFLAVFYSTKLDRNIYFLENINKVIVDNIVNVISFPIKSNKHNTIVDDVRNRALLKEIDILKKELDLKNTYTDYDKVFATSTIKNKSYWLDNIFIDKGSKDKIKKNMAVITEDGLIGKISRVYPNSSEVSLINSNSNNYEISVMINNSMGILKGKDKDSNLLKVMYISKDTVINKDDIVTTSGLGGVFPKGIYIGKVEKVISDKYNLSKTVYIKSDVNYNNIFYVLVLRGKNV